MYASKNIFWQFIFPRLGIEFLQPGQQKCAEKKIIEFKWKSFAYFVSYLECWKCWDKRNNPQTTHFKLIGIRKMCFINLMANDKQHYLTVVYFEIFLYQNKCSSNQVKCWWHFKTNIRVVADMLDINDETGPLVLLSGQHHLSFQWSSSCSHTIQINHQIFSEDSTFFFAKHGLFC